MSPAQIEAKFYEAFQETAVRSALKVSVPRYEDTCHAPLIKAFVQHPDVRFLQKYEENQHDRLYDWKQICIALVHSLLESCSQALRAPTTISPVGFLVSCAKDYNYKISEAHKMQISHQGMLNFAADSPKANRIKRAAKQNKL